MLLSKPSGRRSIVKLRKDFDESVVAFRTSILEGVAVTGAADVTIVERKRMIAVKRVVGLYIREPSQPIHDDLSKGSSVQ